ncbi:S41 family peptidase [Butyrivibrio sp. JL13D10]|uniref:S41 family peptidase n=1 Tax=Butyrivibrio sp. JL13D10 TaxID=3236815 RepID=UPI0038B436A3
MTYKEIFSEIVSIMEKDSATYPDYGAGEHEKYSKLITNDMERSEFVHVVQQYLSGFKVYAHVSFRDTTMKNTGFSVMRYEDKLYVTGANKDTGLIPGDKITQVDGMTIPEIEKKEQVMLMGESLERQGMLWPSIITFYHYLTVEHDDGTIEEVQLKRGTESEQETDYHFRTYENGTLYLRFKDFVDADAISKLFDDCKKELDTCKNLIIDVRGNGGGADLAYFPLFEYCFPNGEPVNKYVNIQYPVAINYSERNCNDRIKLIKSFFGDSIPEDVKPIADKMLSDLKSNFGKGLIEERDDTPLDMCGRTNPEKVWIITDEGCGSSGDSFVEAMSFSPKVTIVGRPTAGITDYSNVSMVDFDDFKLVYPTSRDTRIDHGKGLGQKGVPVDVYIPWNPDSIGKDVELEYVLKQIAEH